MSNANISNFFGTGFQIVWDMPALKQKAIPPFVFLRMALETCRNISELEFMLKNTVRDGGMNLFVVDGKDNSFRVFECTCKNFTKRQTGDGYIVGANHYNATNTPQDFSSNFSDSRQRQKTVESMLIRAKSVKTPCDFIRILSSSDVERDNGLSGTVYSNIACPAMDRLWYACNGFPAASKSKWEQLKWEW